MSLLVSIFGGMILTGVLYAVGRRARLSNYWAAVIAATVPAVAYLAWIVGRPVGLDTITLHVIAYPTVAVLLAMLNGDKARRTHQAHWAPKLLVGFFLVMVTLMAGFVYIAGQGLPPGLARLFLPNATDKTLHTGFAGVVEHHRSAAKGIGQYLGMEHKLARLGWQVEVVGLESARPGEPIPVRVRVSDGEGQLVSGLTVAIALTRPGQESARPYPLKASPEGYLGSLGPLESGAWIATLGVRQGETDIRLEHTLEVAPAQ
ncbi:MAG: FixH family protein [Pseudomonadota bacterium]